MTVCRDVAYVSFTLQPGYGYTSIFSRTGSIESASFDVNYSGIVPLVSYYAQTTSDMLVGEYNQNSSTVSESGWNIYLHSC